MVRLIVFFILVTKLKESGYLLYLKNAATQGLESMIQGAFTSTLFCYGLTPNFLLSDGVDAGRTESAVGIQAAAIL